MVGKKRKKGKKKRKRRMWADQKQHQAIKKRPVPKKEKQLLICKRKSGLSDEVIEGKRRVLAGTLKRKEERKKTQFS